MRAAVLTLALLAAAAAGSQAQEPDNPQRTARQHLDRADALHRAGLDTPAAEELKAALLIDPDLRVPASLRALSAKPETPATAQDAAALARAGLHAEAKTALVAAITANPRLPIPAELRYLSGGWPERAQLWISTRAVPVLALGLQIALAGLVVVALDRRIRRAWRPVIPTVSVEDFDASGVEWAIGKTVSALVEQTLKRSTTADGHRGLQITRGPIEPIKVPTSITSPSPAAGPTVAFLHTLVAWLLPPDHLEVCGLLHKPGRFGAGLTLMVVRNKRVLDSVTVWEQDFAAVQDPAVAQSYYTLVEPAVIWLQFRLNALFPTGPRRFDILGATEWSSYALFRAGARIAGVDDGAAIRAYERALLIDPRNRGARANLGAAMVPVTPIPVSPSEKRDRRRRRKLAITELARARDESGTRIDPASILARYMLAAVISEDSSDKGLAEAETLVRLMRAALEEDALPETTREYLNAMLAPAVVMWVGLMPPERSREASEEMKTVDTTAPSAELQYNLACSQSLAGSRAGASSSCLHIALEHLGKAIAIRPDLAEQARVDPCLTAVRDSSATAARFLELVDGVRPAPATPATALSALDVIGAGADKLLRAGVASPGDLLLRTSTDLGIAVLAAELPAAEATVRRWAQAVQFLSIPGVTVPHVNVLMRAGVSTVGALAGMSALQLSQVFEDFAGAVPEAAVPQAMELAVWVNTANGMDAIT